MRGTTSGDGVYYRVTATDGTVVEIEAPNWFLALGQAMETTAVPAEVMERWICTPRPGGGMFVQDPVTGTAWSVAPMRGAAARPRVVELGQPPRRDPASDGPFQRRPHFVEPLPEALDPESERLYTEETVPVQLFEWGREFVGRPPNEACGLALKLALRFIPAHAGSVMRGSLNDVSLTIVAASGPVASELLGRKIPLGEGLAGLCYDKAIPVMLHDASKHESHFDKFDSELGFQTRGMLCVPVLNDDGVYGVIQLLNPARPFTQDDVDVLTAVANTLASALAQDR